MEIGYGASPATWIPLASGTGPAAGTLAHWVPDSGTPAGTLVFRLTATDANGVSRSAWTPVTMLSFALAEPFEGQLVGPSFPCLLAGDGTGVQSIAFQDNGVTFATVTGSLSARCVPAPNTDGIHAISAVVTATTGATVSTPAVNVTVQHDLYGANARVADDGRAFVMPNGQTTVLIGENDGTQWPGCYDLWHDNNRAATDSYVAGLAASGVNCMRIMLEDGGGPDGYIESPLGNFAFNPKDLNFWDQFLPLCSKYNMTVLLTPWDTFWMNKNWSTNPYNAANGGPCVTDHDFIVNPVARAAQKARLKFMIDRWGNSSAILAYDLLNEFDIWWSASDSERKAWIDDMAQYVQDYEYQKWGHRHMITVSTANAQPSGVIGDVQYLYPRFEFSNTHQYYSGTVNNPRNIIDPAISVNGGVRYSLQYIRDGRPYVDSESGPIDKWIADETFDDLYYHHMAWAHFASGGCGIGMRWPYRNPHYLTAGMHATQKAVAIVAKDIDWTAFHVANADSRVSTNHSGLITMASGDEEHAVIWVTEDVRQQAASSIGGVTLTFSGLAPGRYCVSCWDTNSGTRRSQAAATPNAAGSITFPLPTLTLDWAVTIRPPHLGDATADGIVTIADALRALRFAAGFTRPNVEQALNADVNGDGVVDVLDAVHIARYVAGLETF
jgi:mannan endo-1,4-beta-mannosidase